ncbi:MAG: DUF5615 family PIN-like protein [Chloroflexi bacterium]|nr:DUF5615 family PIN-like protein [Chloroflexota bacterium]MBK6712277.1 DUF5615 family PIN-like protein [Chloroflexota bacterium]
MQIKLDENLPVELAVMLRQLGHDAETVPEENLDGADDDQVWQAAQAENRFLITQDLDFSNVQHFKPGTHHGVLLLRLNNPTRRQLIQKVEVIFTSEAVAQWSGCLVVVTDRKIRVKSAK